ncbi:hypothetical protein J6590_094664 [Homalodisca vitripennis]|nr:hypothetical protein J6590_094664 [Homalodisca vitripennis]
MRSQLKPCLPGDHIRMPKMTQQGCLSIEKGTHCWAWVPHEEVDREAALRSLVSKVVELSKWWSDFRTTTNGRAGGPLPKKNIVPTGKRNRAGEPILKPTLVMDYNLAKKGKMIKFRGVLLRELIKAEDTSAPVPPLLLQQTGRKRPVPKHKLLKREGPARKSRKRCVQCYQEKVLEVGTKEARNKTKKFTFLFIAASGIWRCLRLDSWNLEVHLKRSKKVGDKEAQNEPSHRFDE